MKVQKKRILSLLLCALMALNLLPAAWAEEGNSGASAEHGATGEISIPGVSGGMTITDEARLDTGEGEIEGSSSEMGAAMAPAAAEYTVMLAENAETKEETPEEKAAREKKEADDKKAKGQAANNEEIPAWAKVLTEQVTALNSQINANADKAKGEMRAAVKAKFGLDDLAVNALDGAALDGLYAQCQKSTGLNGAFRQVNNNESFSEMPE